MCGLLVRSNRLPELSDHLNKMKAEVALSSSTEIHFRDLEQEIQLKLLSGLGAFKCGIIAVVSNKRNMRRYRNRRIERKLNEIDGKGRIRPQRNSWFYNHIFRYLLERASAECNRVTQAAYGEFRTINVIFAQKRGFNYAQSRAYLEKLRVERHDRSYFNNKQQITWSVVDPMAVVSARPKTTPGLQLADCAASGIHRAIDEDWYGCARPDYLEALVPRLLQREGSAKNFGFTLLPENFSGPLSDTQRKALALVGYRLRHSSRHIPE